MSKIICDVCGTSYPDTASQCPICGCVRSADVEAVVAGQEAAQTVATGTYTYVKGGRFSKANVKKRNSGKPVVTASAPAPVKTAAPAKAAATAPQQKSNLGLIIVIIVLLLAIVAVLSYIAIRFIVPNIMGETSSENVSQNDSNAPGDLEPNDDPAELEIPCTGVSISDTEVILTAVDESYPLSVIPAPEDTTDVVEYESADETIATVDADGMITAVAAGQTTITVTCGDQTAQCTVICDIVTDEPDEELALDAEEHTFAAKGETWTCYTGTIAAEDITWSSDDETVAIVSDGVVTAVGAGTTNIRAEYNGQEVSCAILCNDTVDTTQSSGQTDNDNTDNQQSSAANANYKFNTHDKNEMMLAVGESFSLRLCDENGKALSGVKYTSSNANVCTVTEKGTVKCVAYGSTVTISAEYNGAVYKCKVYIR